MTLTMTISREGADIEEAAELAEHLRRELLDDGIADARRPERDGPPSAKGSAIEWAELVVTSVSSLPTLISAALAWVSRGSGRRVSMNLDGDAIELSGVTLEQQDRLIQQWIERHSA